MKSTTKKIRSPFLRVREPYLALDASLKTRATVDLPKSQQGAINFIVDIYLRNSPSHPDRHVGWWLWRWEGQQTTLDVSIAQSPDGEVSVSIPELGDFEDCWTNETLQKKLSHEALLVHCVLRDGQTSAMLFVESLYMFRQTQDLQAHLDNLKSLRALLEDKSGTKPFCWPSDRRVALVTDTFSPNSGVGRFLVGLCRTLHGNEIAYGIYADAPSPDLRGVVSRTTDLIFEKRPENIGILYNHSIHDASLAFLQQLPNPKVLYFHNITPPEYYAVYDAEYARHCESGREQLRELSGFSHFLANSQYSAQVLSAYLAPESKEGDEATVERPVPVGVAPPLILPSTSCNGQAPESALPLPAENRILLFVGRISPHKRIEDLLSLFHEYRKPHDDTALVVAGQEDSGTYTQYLSYLLSKGPADNRKHIYFYKDIDDAGLAKLYRHASAYLCMSEHEGFCIPLIEAMSFNVPIFAYAQPAVAETLGGCGVLFHEKDFAAIARTVHRVLDREDVLQNLLSGQQQRLDHFRRQATGALILQTLDEAYRCHEGRL